MEWLLLRFDKKHFFILFLTFVLFSSMSMTITSEESQGYVMPVASLKPPKIVLLDTLPKPRSILVPEKPGGSYIKQISHQEVRVDLLPPETKPAGIFYSMEHYTTVEGLSIDSVACGIVDKLGNLWIGTRGGGASKYNGKSFTTYTTSEGLPLGDVHSIFEDKSGNLWFGTHGGGVSKYDGISFTTYTAEEGLADNYVSSILEDKSGNLWFGTEKGGVSKYNDKSFTSYTKKDGLADNYVTSILEDKMGNLWFSTKEGVSKYNGKSFTTYTTKEGLADNYVTSILEDKMGNLWFGTNEGGVSKYNGKSFITYTTKEGLIDNHVTCILEDERGNLWFGTMHGASEYDGKAFTAFTTAEGLADNYVQVILKDKTGNLWFGLWHDGLCKFNGKFIANFKQAQGLPSSYIRSILEDKTGNLWFGTRQGLSKYDGKFFTNYTIEQGLADNFILSSLEDKAGNLWFGTNEGGVSKYDGKSFITYTKEQGLASNLIRYILEDETGNLWFGTFEGVSKYDGKSFTTYTTDQGLPGNDIWCILEDKMGSLWFATGGGVSKYDGKSFTTYTTAQGLAHNDVSDIIEDQGGNLWICTAEGISRYDGSSFTTYSVEQGLPNNLVYAAAFTKEQDIIMGTNYGIAILKGYTPLSSASGEKHGKVGEVTIPSQNNLKNEALKSCKPVFEIYNTKRGYSINDANAGDNTIYLDSNGIVWIATGSEKSGLVRLDYSKLNKSNSPPNIVIQSVKVNYKNVIWLDLMKNNSVTQSSKAGSTGITTPPYETEEALAFGRILNNVEKNAMRSEFNDVKFNNISKFYYVPKNLKLPYRCNNIAFDFAAIEPALPQDVLYQCKLEGYDKNWRTVTTTTNISFGNIHEGTYQFKVKAQNPFGIWSEPLTYTFKVLPPWYRTWWAYLFYGISSIATLVLIFRWRMAVLRHRLERSEFLYHAAERFVPKRVLKLLKREHFEDVQLGDSTQLPLSAMFADIRGFTTISESMTPQQITLILNTYIQHMVPIIQQNQGFISQFLGDGILALFSENPSNAVDAALQMAEDLPAVNKDLAEKGFAPIRVGIGVNTGDAMLCALGVPSRLEASVVSDAINISSRVESLNKYYKTELLITDTVHRTLDSKKYLIRLVDKVILKGKITGTGIYEVKLLPAGDELEKERQYYAQFVEAFGIYEKGDFAKAENAFKSCLSKNPNDGVAALLMKRCMDFQKMGAPPDWNGFYAFTEK